MLNPTKKGEQDKPVYPAHPFLAAAAAGFGHIGDLRYHEVKRIEIRQ